MFWVPNGVPGSALYCSAFAPIVILSWWYSAWKLNSSLKFKEINIASPLENAALDSLYVRGTRNSEPRTRNAYDSLSTCDLPCVDVHLTVCSAADIHDLEWPVAAALEIVSLPRRRGASLIFHDDPCIPAIEKMVGE